MTFTAQHEYQSLNFVPGGSVTGGNGHTNGQYYNVKLFNSNASPGSAVWDGATAEVTVTGGSVSKLEILDGGSGYTNGENLYVDNRGKISNHELTEPINLIGLIDSKKGTIRANHYHPQQEQKCLFTKGQIIEIFQDLLNPNSPKITQVVNEGQISTIKPNVAHTMVFTKDTTFLNLVRGERDHENYGITHTVKHVFVDEKEKNTILSSLPPKDRFALLESLSYPEDSAARLMQREFTAIPSNWSVGQTIDYLRENKELPEEFLEIFIVDQEFKPIGTVPSSRVLRTPRDTKMMSIMAESQTLIPVDMDREEVGNLFENYNLSSAAVVDKSDKLVGMIAYDDVLTVLKEEAEEDALRLAGVGDEEITDGVITKTKRRFNWLLLNLFTAFLATYCISLFGATIEQMVVLAFLMPIVASMGGNAGMQTLACLLYTSPSPRDVEESRMPSSA